MTLEQILRWRRRRQLQRRLTRKWITISRFIGKTSWRIRKPFRLAHLHYYPAPVQDDREFEILVKFKKHRGIDKAIIKFSLRNELATLLFTREKVELELYGEYHFNRWRRTAKIIISKDRYDAMREATNSFNYLFEKEYIDSGIPKPKVMTVEYIKKQLESFPRQQRDLEDLQKIRAEKIKEVDEMYRNLEDQKKQYNELNSKRIAKMEEVYAVKQEYEKNLRHLHAMGSPDFVKLDELRNLATSEKREEIKKTRTIVREQGYRHLFFWDYNNVKKGVFEERAYRNNPEAYVATYFKMFPPVPLEKRMRRNLTLSRAARRLGRVIKRIRSYFKVVENYRTFRNNLIKDLEERMAKKAIIPCTVWSMLF